MVDVEAAYQNALDYLYSFVDYSLTRNLRYSPEKFDLGRMAALMARLGNPQNTYPVFHVAGTKGKGSTSAMIASSLLAAGYRVGFYTSPHLSDYCERIQVNGTPIPHQDLVEMVEALKPHVAAIEHLTTFEITTAVAFEYFARQKCEVGVIEVGLGGRLDATNIVTPLVSVITSLSMDHMNVLGNTLALIAGEKAGIIKPRRPVVLAPQKDEARLVVERVAQERGARLVELGRDVHFSAGAHSTDSQTLLVWPDRDQALASEYIESGGQTQWKPTQLTIPLLGLHQVENAATAYTALQVGREEGLVIPQEAILSGLSRVSWPARFEFLQRYPPVVIDAAHNRDSAARLRQAIDDYLPGQEVVLVFGASEDKDIQGMFAELMPRVRQVVATQSVHPRALEANKLVELAHQFGRPAVAVVPLEDALEKALDLADHSAAVVVTGSIFVAAAVRDVWQRR